MTAERDFTAEEIAAGEKLFERAWGFHKGVVDLAFLPLADRAEIAFAGRSNVGKSSLINALTRQGGLARTSNTPGRTQELNVFLPQGFREPGPLYLFDMPGYGFAKAPKDKVDQWTALVKDYLRGRASLKRVFLLIDARHGIKPIDAEVMAMLDAAAVTYQIVLTKVDKISLLARAKLIAATGVIIGQHPAAYPFLIATSAEKNEGLAELRATIADLVD
ncbi:MAG: ribosome biogenesis GTP-binding protein YihA/YsxC [Hyphomicrobiaceae bacterium]|nr:ribosome biogenesis GTP-binding protein YihA/YsxC [Hyphomicrobiaceae bacterium]